MTDTVLDLLTWALLGLLYLFFARVLWTVWTEVRTPQPTTAATITRDTITRGTSTRNTSSGNTSPGNISTDPTVNLGDLTAVAHHLATHEEQHDSRSQRSSRGGRGTRGATLPRTAAHEIVFLAPRSHKGRRIALEASTVLTIGRADTCSLAFPEDTYISGLHAQIRVHDGQPVVEDLGSTNGTFHNGNRLHGLALLHPGDRVQIGQAILEAR